MFGYKIGPLKKKKKLHHTHETRVMRLVIIIMQI